MKVYYKHISGRLFDFDVMSDSPTIPFYLKSEADAQIALKDLEIKLLKSHYRQGYFDLMKAQLDDPIAAGEKVKEIDAEIQQRLAKG